MKSGNAAIHTHKQEGRALRLFKGVRGEVEYLGEFEMDEKLPFYNTDAREAAEAFGAERWFSDPLAMIHDDLVDVVTISVKVPAHRELVLAALEAGKPVYCEAPLGRNLAEAEEMATAVGSLHTAIGCKVD